MSSESNTASGRVRLMESATKLFAERSYVEVGIAEILKVSGVQAPTLYHHFGDKEKLFVAWAEQAFLKLGDEIRQSTNDMADPLDALTALAERVGECAYLPIFRTLDSAKRLRDLNNVARIEQAYFRAIFEPLCIALMAASDAGRIAIDAIDRSASVFLMGSLAVSSKNELPGSGADSNYRWWVNHFVFGFIRPLP